jgi:hypothetical protein
VVKGGCGGKGGEMTQTLYVHMNKKKDTDIYILYQMLSCCQNALVKYHVWQKLMWNDALLIRMSLMLWPAVLDTMVEDQSILHGDKADNMDRK